MKLIPFVIIAFLFSFTLCDEGVFIVPNELLEEETSAVITGLIINTSVSSTTVTSSTTFTPSSITSNTSTAYNSIAFSPTQIKSQPNMNVKTKLGDVTVYGTLGTICVTIIIIVVIGAGVVVLYIRQKAVMAALVTLRQTSEIETVVVERQHGLNDLRAVHNPAFSNYKHTPIPDLSSHDSSIR